MPHNTLNVEKSGRQRDRENNLVSYGKFRREDTNLRGG